MKKSAFLSPKTWHDRRIAVNKSPILRRIKSNFPESPPLVENWNLIKPAAWTSWPLASPQTGARHALNGVTWLQRREKIPWAYLTGRSQQGGEGSNKIAWRKWARLYDINHPVGALCKVFSAFSHICLLFVGVIVISSVIIYQPRLLRFLTLCKHQGSFSSHV